MKSTQTLATADQGTQRNAILLGVYALTGGNPERMVLIKEELNPVIGLEIKEIWDLAGAVIDEKKPWMLWGGGGRLSITFTGIPVVEALVREWVVERTPRNSIADILERAYGVLQELEWHRYTLMQAIRLASRDSGAGWADSDRAIELSGLGKDVAKRADKLLRQMAYIREPEIDSVTLSIEGSLEFERIQRALRAIHKSKEIGPREFVVALPKIWARTTKGEPLRLEPELFPTPPGATWKDVEIRFIDDSTVRVTVMKVTQVLNFTQLRMVDKKRGLPDRQWELLRDLAERGGVLSWDSSPAGSKLQKRKERLSRRLKDYFWLAEEPIPWRDGEWRTKFALSRAASTNPPGS